MASETSTNSMLAWTTWFVVGTTVLVGFYALHRLGLWMERRGWIYYSKGHGRASMGNAIQGFQSIFEQEMRPAIHEIRTERGEEDEQGDPIDSRNDSTAEEKD
jgi:hypothetical protein